VSHTTLQSGSTAGPDSRPNARRLRVLIAEDDRDTVASLEALLQDEGHEAVSVYHGGDVKIVVAMFRPDVVLLDIGMPGMTGYDVARELNQAYGSARPVLIAITGWAKSADRLMAIHAGFDHHVAKPYDPRALLSLVASAAERGPLHV
jgi:CheY-like chemotaxis protein